MSARRTWSQRRARTGRSIGALVAAALLLIGCGRTDDASVPAGAGDAALPSPTLAESAGFDDLDDRLTGSAKDETLRVDRLDPCALLTRDEAETIVRARLLDARPNNVGSDRPSCTYGADPAGTTAQVQLFVGDGAESLIAVNRRLGGDNIEVEELGDGAFLRHTTLHFHAAGLPVVLSVVRLVEAKTLHPAMIAAAQSIVQRMAYGQVAAPPAPADPDDAAAWTQ